MPGRPRKIPSYCRHKASGQAVVRIDGRDEYLGNYATPESWEKYHRLMAERFPSGPNPSAVTLSAPSPPAFASDLTITELVAAYWQHAKEYYVKNGRPTSEQTSIRLAFRPLLGLYGHTECRSFGPLALATVRNRMIEAEVTRKRINQHVGRIRRMFKWGVSRELIPAGISTPFLRQVARIWNCPDDYVGDEDHLMYESWETPAGGGDRFPKHPFCIALLHDLFRSSAEAIQEWLEPDIVPTIGECYGQPPISLCLPETVRDHIAAIHVGESRKSAPTPLLDRDLAQVEHPQYEYPTFREVDNGHFGKLLVGRIVVKEFKQPADEQCKILEAFEESNWDSRVPNPFCQQDRSQLEQVL